jgi:hypothetical protein
MGPHVFLLQAPLPRQGWYPSQLPVLLWEGGWLSVQGPLDAMPNISVCDGKVPLAALLVVLLRWVEASHIPVVVVVFNYL